MGYYERIAAYLSQFVRQAGTPGVIAEPGMIRAAIQIILENRVMTVEQMRRECLEQFDAIIRWDLFPEAVMREEMNRTKGSEP